MSYSWTDTLTVGSQTIDAHHINDIRTNAQTERTARGLGAYGSYTQTPAQYTTKILNADIAETRLSIDGAYDENHCQSHYHHYTGHYTAYYPSYYQCSTYYSVYRSNAYVTRDNASNITYNVSNLATYCSPYV